MPYITTELLTKSLMGSNNPPAFAVVLYPSRHHTKPGSINFSMVLSCWKVMLCWEGDVGKWW